MSSLYEIHISVSLSRPDEEISWIWFCKSSKIKSIRVLNDSGYHSEQNMITKWCSRDTPEEAIEYAEELSETIEWAGFNVIRIKVEGMIMNKAFDTKYLERQKGIYWEFHLKISINDSNELKILRNWKESVANEFNIGLSISDRSETQYPIITFRIHEGNRDFALFRKDELVKSLKDNKFHIHDKLQSECSIYDTFPEEDEGWIL